MNLLRHIITIVCIAVAFIANAGEQQAKGGGGEESKVQSPESKVAGGTKKESVVQSPESKVNFNEELQGTWEGVLVGDAARQKITITITNNSLHFHRDTNFWFETTITLSAGKDPKQLHATIKGCPKSQADSMGKVVKAFFKIEDATLTLATIGDDAEETPKGFEAAGTRYELKKVGKVAG